MAKIVKRGDGYLVRWSEWHTVVGDDGRQRRLRRQPGRQCPTRAAAEKLKRLIEETQALGRRWTPDSEKPTVTLETIALAYVRAAVDAGAPLATQRFRSSMVEAFLSFAGPDRIVADLTIGLLRDYAWSLPSQGRKAGTRHRKVLEAERLWAWAAEDPDRYPGVPQPRRITGAMHADRIRPPPPVVAMSAPTWADVDAMLAHLDRREWHRRLGVLLRYTGLRVTQGLRLHWRDADLDRSVLRVRAGQAGAKRARTRVMPLHPALRKEMACWGPRDGLVFRRPDGRPWRGDAALGPFRRAWRCSGVPQERWGAGEQGDGLTGARAHGRPTHAIRACVRTGLIRLGVEEAIALYLTGHSQGITAAAYVPEDRPEESPYWPRMVDAIARIPRIGAEGRVIALRTG